MTRGENILLDAEIKAFEKKAITKSNVKSTPAETAAYLKDLKLRLNAQEDS